MFLLLFSIIIIIIICYLGQGPSDSEGTIENKKWAQVKQSEWLGGCAHSMIQDADTWHNLQVVY